MGDHFVREGQEFRYVSDGQRCFVLPSVCARGQPNKTPSSSKRERLGEGPVEIMGNHGNGETSPRPRTLCGKQIQDGVGEASEAGWAHQSWCGILRF